jgi:hypothetical protein
MSTTTESNWVPEIMYEEGDGGVSSNIPFIAVPETEEMPRILFIFESRDTGEIEPGPSGEQLPIFELDLHQYADMSILKENLPEIVYDQVRNALGLEPLKQATLKGQKITESVRQNISEN